MPACGRSPRPGSAEGSEPPRGELLPLPARPQPRAAAWWQSIAPQLSGDAGQTDPIADWFQAAGVQKIERLVELLSLDPIADAEAAR